MADAPKEVANKFRDSFKDDDCLPASDAHVSAMTAFVEAIRAIPMAERPSDERLALKFIKYDPVSALESRLVRRMIGSWYESARRSATKDERQAARDNLESFTDALRPRKRGPGAITLSDRELLRLFELCRDHYDGKSVRLPPSVAKEAKKITKKRTATAAAKRVIARLYKTTEDLVDLRVRQAKKRYKRFMAALSKQSFEESEFDKLFSPGSFEVAVAPMETKIPSPSERADGTVSGTESRSLRRTFTMRRKR